MKNIEIGEDGYILVTSLMAMVIVILLGVSGINTSIFETKMAANKALHKQSFYEADGATEVGLAILKHNINCISGFGTDGLDGRITLSSTWTDKSGYSVADADMPIDSRNLWMTNNIVEGTPRASNNNRDFYYNPIGVVANAAGPRISNVRVNGRTKLTVGSALEMTAGYEGRGKSLGADGASLSYQIHSQYIGERNSETAICIEYRVDNQFANSPAGNCIY